MADIQTNTSPISTQKKKDKSRIRAKRIRSAILTLAIMGGMAAGGYYLYNFLNTTEEVSSTLYSEPAGFGSIESTVSGSGMARAKETAAITLPQNGLVEEVFVMSGDIVMAGQPLYTIVSPEAQEAVAAAQEELDKLNAQMTDLMAKGNQLTTRAPFAGKLVDISQYQVDDIISEGTTICTLVNDKQLKLSLYYSYAYENDIKVGQQATVSIPAVMGTYNGTVEQVNKVSYISPQGGVYFHVVIVFDNPGTLTAEMVASAFLSDKNGSPIYPYESGTVDYYEIREIRTEASGPMVSHNDLVYSNISAGEVLMIQGSATIDSDIAAKQVEIDLASQSLADAQASLGNFNAVAPIDGRITSTSSLLIPGGEIKAGETTVVISNTTNMQVDITVDDRNISFVKPGMYVELSDWNGNVFMGTVGSIDTANAEMGMGMTSYPVSLSVENFSGALMDGTWLEYSFVANQSEACIQVPMQAVKYVSDENGDTYTVVFVKADEKPENTVDLELPETLPGEKPQYPTQEEGYYPLPVEAGLSDNYNVEIKSGLNGDEEVFVSYIVEQAWS